MFNFKSKLRKWLKELLEEPTLKKKEKNVLASTLKQKQVPTKVPKTTKNFIEDRENNINLTPPPQDFQFLRPSELIQRMSDEDFVFLHNQNMLSNFCLAVTIGKHLIEKSLTGSLSSPK